MRAKFLASAALVILLVPQTSEWQDYEVGLVTRLGQFIGFDLEAQASNVVMSSAAIESAEIAALPEAVSEALSTPSNVRTVTVNRLNMREAPHQDEAVLGKLRSGTEVVVAEENDGWLKIMLESGETGWVSAQYLALA